jgi:hypothetical protein
MGSERVYLNLDTPDKRMSRIQEFNNPGYPDSGKSRNIFFLDSRGIQLYFEDGMNKEGD